MVDGPKGVPLEETLRLYRRFASVGLFLKALYDARPPEEDVTRIKLPEEDKKWNKWARRYRYKEGMVVNGKKVGGQFTEAPDHAPADRKRKGKKRLRKKRAST